MKGIHQFSVSHSLPELIYSFEESCVIRYYVGHFVGNSFRINYFSNDYGSCVIKVDLLIKLNPRIKYHIFKHLSYLQKLS